MMDLLLATSGGEPQSASGGYVDDVFSAYTYTGNGATQTITNGIDLAGKGGLVWVKWRSNGGGGYSTRPHVLVDTERGVKKDLGTSSTSAQGSGTDNNVTSFNSNGFFLGNSSVANSSPDPYVSWTFRKAPKFFDIVTYTGNGASNRTLSHQLNADVGMITVKATSTTGDWWVFHRSATGDLVLNTTAVQTASKANIPSATTSTFTVNGSANTNGVTYVAYLWAHDPSTEGIIQCGGYTGNGSDNAIYLGWEPQYLLVRSSSATDNWSIVDSSRGWNLDSESSYGVRLYAHTSDAERSATCGFPAATGFNAGPSIGNINTSGRTYIYLAIRRPNKPPTSGTEVYNAIARTGTDAAATVTGVGFAPDLSITKKRSSTTLTGARFVDRLRGATRWLDSSAATAETATADTVTGLDSMSGIVLGADATTSAFNTSGHTYINHFFRRAKGFFDLVCWEQVTGGSATVSHSLGAVPELIITKQRNGTRAWDTYHKDFTSNYFRLNENTGAISGTNFDNVTASSFRAYLTNSSTNVAYLFASLVGISKVGSYTGNGTSQTINCGFSTGARFILIKRTDATGDWYVWDTVRGIVAADDPHLSLNTNAAEVTTDDSVDPDASGFIVNQNTATNINVNGGSYIFLAIA